MKLFKLFLALIVFIFIINSVSSVNFNVTGCNTSINISGNYYLQNDIINRAGDCFRFKEDNIIFDCQGHLVDGNDVNWQNGFDHDFGTSNNIIIKNCNVRDFSYCVFF